MNNLNFKGLFRKSKTIESSNNVSNDTLIELANNEVDKVIAVGYSSELGKWFFNDDRKYSMSKQLFSSF